MKYEEIEVGMEVFKIGDYHMDRNRVKLLRGKVIEKEPNKRTLVDWTNDRGETYEESQNIFPTIDEAVDDMNEWLVDATRSLWRKMNRRCPEVERALNAICSASWAPIKRKEEVKKESIWFVDFNDGIVREQAEGIIPPRIEPHLCGLYSTETEANEALAKHYLEKHYETKRKIEEKK